MTGNARHLALTSFVGWVREHLKGDEKGEAQIFLDRMFQGFGWPGLKEAKATCEERIKNDNGGTSFADLVWKPIVVIEMKKRGTDLSKHYRQAFDYWMRLVPNRPRYAVLCNFDEFWVYDFDTQFDAPVGMVSLDDLPTAYGPLNFMFPGDVAPIFGNHHETVTRQAADKLAACFSSMLKRGIERPLAQRFVLQMLMSLFAEDIGLLERYFVTGLLEECKSPQDTYDILGSLFEAMNTPGGVRGGRYKNVAYFNGGLFANPARVELVADERTLLKDAAKFDWSMVRPEIFGTLFEHSLDAEERHAFGAHFTSPTDIMKIVGPTIVEPWRQQIAEATTLKALRALLARIERFTVLDPACGSGNFLYVAYRELKRVEASIYERMATLFPKSVDPAQRAFGFVTSSNFYGIDVNPFAVDIAKVTMMLAHKLSIDELHINEQALPLDNLDGNIVLSDALVQPDGSRTTWPAADVIIGNPPFLGAKLLKPNFGPDYVRRVRAAYPEVPGMADFCVYWFRRANDAISTNSAEDPVAGRAGLVGTQNVRNNDSRVGGLEAIASTGTILDAVDNQPWSGEANVHVSIVNWVKTHDEALLPSERRLWFKSDQAVPANSKGAAGPASKRFNLDMRVVDHINSSLSDKVDVATAAVLACNTSPQRVFQGITPGHKAFVVDQCVAEELSGDGTSSQVIYPFIGGDEILSGLTAPVRFLIDFEQFTVLKAQRFTRAFAQVKAHVLPARMKASEEGKDEAGEMRSHHKQFLDRWWQLSWGRADLLTALQGKSRYLACSRVTKLPIFAFLAGEVRPGDSLQVFVFDDDYSFGILQSSAHEQWFIAKGSKLKADLRYTPDSVFDTFPWPQAPSAAQVAAVALAGRALRKLRADSVLEAPGGLRALYKNIKVPGRSPLKSAHAALDAAVLAAFGFSAGSDVLQQLLDLNAVVARQQSLGNTVNPPGIPSGFAAVDTLMTNDCIGRVASPPAVAAAKEKPTEGGL
jgi:hypothetical protein